MRFIYFAILIAVSSIIGCSSKAPAKEPDSKLITLNDSIVKANQRISLSSMDEKIVKDTDILEKDLLGIEEEFVKFMK